MFVTWLPRHSGNQSRAGLGQAPGRPRADPGQVSGKLPNQEIKMASGSSSSETKETNAKSTPRDARAMKAILKEMGIEDYEPRVINQMLEFTYRKYYHWIFFNYVLWN